jgi:hypothetical protein
MKYENRFKVEDDILDLLGDDFNENTANMIAKKLAKNWYTITRLLTEMWVKGKVEKLELGRSVYWKKRKDNELVVNM